MVSSWELGRPTPADDIPKIAAALGVSICGLYGVEEGHIGMVDPGLLSAEREALDNIARELVKLRSSPRAQQGRGRGVQRRLHEEWPSMSEVERQEWREFAQEIRQADEGSL